MRFTRSLFVPLLLTLVLATSARAQWKPGGVAFPITPFDDWSCLVPDGAGGVFELFPPVFGPREVHSQHLLANGAPDPLDGGTGRMVAPAPYGVGNAAALADGSGGVLVMYLRCGPIVAHTRCWENGTYRLVRSRDGLPAPGWPDTGIVLGPSTFYTLPPFVGDGAGGAVVRLGDALQRWTGAGAMAWTPEAGWSGVRFGTGSAPRLSPQLAEDGAGGAWVAWSESYFGDPVERAVRLAHVSSAGVRLTGGAGLLLTTGAQLRACGIAPDGAGGVYVAWSLPGTWLGQPADQVLVQHVDAAGDAWWSTDGVPAGYQSPGLDVALLAAGNDAVALAVRSEPAGRRVQKLEAGGAAWPDAPDGRDVGVPGSPPDALALVRGADGGLFVAWTDARDGDQDPWLTLLDAAGHAAPGWTLSGTALANLPATESLAALVPGAAPGEAIAAWWRPSTAYPGLFDLVATKAVTGGLLDAAPLSAALALSAPWPNPARDGWWLRFAVPGAGRVALELFDVAGRRVWSERMQADGAGAHTVRIDAGGLPPGSYRLRLRTGEGERTRMLLKLR